MYSTVSLILLVWRAPDIQRRGEHIAMAGQPFAPGFPPAECAHFISVQFIDVHAV